MNNKQSSNRIAPVIVFIALQFLFNNIYCQPFKFAWITDIHVGNNTGQQDLINTVMDINSNDQMSFILISGDITETGKNTDLELAKTILDGLNKPYYIIPGNHDTKWSQSGCTKFSQVFNSDKFIFNYNEICFIGMAQGPIMKMGDGHFSPEDLRWLDSTLAKIDNKKPLIFVTHYPLDNQIDNWFTVLDRLKKYNTIAVLCGHGHANKAFSFEGIPGVMSRSNLRGKENYGGYNIVDVNEQSITFTEKVTLAITKPAWNKITIPSNFVADTQKYPRPDYSINKSYPFVNVKWNFKTNYTITSSPVLNNKYVFVTSAGGYAYCLTIDAGTLIWKFKTNGAIYNSPDLQNNKVVFGSNDKFIYCLNASSGNLEWKYETQSPIVASPKIFNNVVYIGSGDGKFRAIDINNGKLIWQFDGIGEFVEAKPLVYDNKVIFGSWDGFLYSLNINDGSLAWKWKGTDGFHFSPAACWPVASNGKIFVAAPDRFATAINSETGKTIWRTNSHKVRESVGISEDGEYFYAKGMQDTLFVFSSSSGNPQLVKAVDCGIGYCINPNMPIEKENVIFFANKNGLLIALDRVSFNILWKYKTGVSLVNTAAPVNKNKVVVTNADGEVMLIESASN